MLINSSLQLSIIIIKFGSPTISQQIIPFIRVLFGQNQFHSIPTSHNNHHLNKLTQIFNQLIGIGINTRIKHFLFIILNFITTRVLISFNFDFEVEKISTIIKMIIILMRECWFVMSKIMVICNNLKF